MSHIISERIKYCPTWLGENIWKFVSVSLGLCPMCFYPLLILITILSLYISLILLAYMVFFSSDFFQNFLFVFDFLQSEYDMPMSRIFVFTLWFSELSASGVWCLSLSLKNISAIINSNISSTLFLLQVFPLHVCYTFCNCFTVLR